MDDRAAAAGPRFIAAAVGAGVLGHEGKTPSGDRLSSEAVALSEGVLRVLRRERRRALAGFVAVLGIVAVFVVLTVHQVWQRASASPVPHRRSDTSTNAERTGFALAAPQPPPRPQSNGELVGLVVGADGSPVQGAIVRLYRSKEDALADRPPAATTQASADGSFLFQHLTPRARAYVLCRPASSSSSGALLRGQAITDVYESLRTDLGRIVLEPSKP
jgi:hypothetical protein